MTDAEQAELMRRQAERWDDPETHRGAQQRMDRAHVRLRQIQPQVTQQLRGMDRSPTFAKRLIWLREAVATATGAIAPHAACKPACPGCCYQPVMVTQAEAQVIARESGAKLAQPPKWRREAAVEFTGQACPFLKESRCSIYAHRPIACRLLLNMDKDALMCQIVPGSPAQVPYADLRQFNPLLLQAHDGIDEAAKMADLREFFPRGGK